VLGSSTSIASSQGHYGGAGPQGPLHARHPHRREDLENSRLVSVRSTTAGSRGARVARRIQERLMSASPSRRRLDVAGTCRACWRSVATSSTRSRCQGGLPRRGRGGRLGKRGVAGRFSRRALQAALRGGRTQAHLGGRSAERHQTRSSTEHSPRIATSTAAYVEIESGDVTRCTAARTRLPSSCAMTVGRSGSSRAACRSGCSLASAYGLGSTTLDHGDRVLLYTDGITEASPGPGREPTFGSSGSSPAARASRDAARRERHGDPRGARRLHEEARVLRDDADDPRRWRRP